MEEYISGEKHKEMSRHANKNLTKPILLVIVGVIAIGLSFYGGVAYQKSKQPKLTANTARGGERGLFAAGGRMLRQRPTVGAVSAISDTSITLNDTNTNTTTTLAITSTTQITNNQQAVAASTIKIGDTVLASASPTDKTQAERIIVNPQFMTNESAGTATQSITQ